MLSRVAEFDSGCCDMAEAGHALTLSGRVGDAGANRGPGGNLRGGEGARHGGRCHEDVHLGHPVSQQGRGHRQPALPYRRPVEAARALRRTHSPEQTRSTWRTSPATSSQC